MTLAIGSPTLSSAAGSGTSTAGLEAQLARCQKDLSEHVNCNSAKTPEGKAAIEALSNRINSVKTRIEEISNTQSSRHPATLNATDANTNSQAAAPIAKEITGIDAASASKSSEAIAGSRLDVFA
jgi:hypothetical protein